MNWPWRLPRDLPWATPYPLPRDTSDALLAEGGCENFGLLLERYLAFGDNRGQVQLVRELADRKALVPDFTGQKDLIAAHAARWRRTAEGLGAVTFAARPQWRVIVGLGTNALLGGGITLHPVFGFPVVPASALKGASRSYARWVLERPAEELDALFGKAEGEDALRGDLLFLEGTPAEPPVVERDVISPVFGPYYRDGRTPPANYLAASPIFFLAVGARSRYWFGVASLSGDPGAAARGARWLQEALTDLGVGAKTGAGYGYWVVEGGPGGGAAGEPAANDAAP
jgi:CRISPR-associated protein Cmr6